MTDKTHDNAESILIAIDIAKQNHDALIRWPGGRTKLLKVPNTHSGYEHLIASARAEDKTITVAFEPTADYHRNIAYWLTELGAQCYLVSSLSCARAREMLFKSRDKHDRKDARVILYLMEQGMMQVFNDPLRGGLMDTQELANTYHQIVLARTRCHNSLINHYLTLYFPEMERYFSSSRAEWFCRFLLKFPVPKAITRYRKQTFVNRAWKVVGRKVAKQRFLEELYEHAENSIGLPVNPGSYAVETFKMQLQRYLDLTLQRSDLEQAAAAMLKENTDYHRLLTLPGVGPIIALMILAESGDLRRFPHYRQYLNFCGFNLSALQSGMKAGEYTLSKRGNARLRYAYWLAAASAIRQTRNSFRYKYERYIKNDPDDRDLKRKARVAVASKMARVAHALIKTDTDYRGYHEFGYGT